MVQVSKLSLKNTNYSRFLYSGCGPIQACLEGVHEKRFLVAVLNNVRTLFSHVVRMNGRRLRALVITQE